MKFFLEEPSSKINLRFDKPITMEDIEKADGLHSYLKPLIDSTKGIIVFKLSSVNREPKASPESSIAKEAIYEDEIIKIEWLASHDKFSCVLENKSNGFLKVIWDESTFISQSKESHKIIHGGVRLSDRNQSLPPTMIPQGSNIKDSVFPSDYVEWGHNDWIKAPMYSDEMLDQGVLRVILTIQKDEKKYIYDFTFKPEKGEKHI